jgi:hypothetical protein
MKMPSRTSGKSEKVVSIILLPDPYSAYSSTLKIEVIYSSEKTNVP